MTQKQISLIDDDAWFELQLAPEKAMEEYGIALPGLPPDEVQIGFTSVAGRRNLQQAFSFYKYARSVSRLSEIAKPKILDFGGGWGRIARFFLKDTPPQNLYVADCMNTAIEWLNATGNPAQIIKNDPRPPVEGLGDDFDLIYAFSVFSHLTEACLLEWVHYLLDRLRPHGCLVFTTRGHGFIDEVERLHRERATLPAAQTALLDSLPSPEVLRQRHAAGELQFFPIGGGGELTNDFYGEMLLPRSYIEKVFEGLLVDFNEAVPDVDQSVAVLRKAG